MSVILGMTVLGAAGIAFYLRFLVALCRESKPHVGGYWVRLGLESDDNLIVERKDREIVAPRAA